MFNNSTTTNKQKKTVIDDSDWDFSEEDDKVVAVGPIVSGPDIDDESEDFYEHPGPSRIIQYLSELKTNPKYRTPKVSSMMVRSNSSEKNNDNSSKTNTSTQQKHDSLPKKQKKITITMTDSNKDSSSRSVVMDTTSNNNTSNTTSEVQRSCSLLKLPIKRSIDQVHTKLDHPMRSRTKRLKYQTKNNDFEITRKNNDIILKNNSDVSVFVSVPTNSNIEITNSNTSNTNFFPQINKTSNGDHEKEMMLDREIQEKLDFEIAQAIERSYRAFGSNAHVYNGVLVSGEIADDNASDTSVSEDDQVVSNNHGHWEEYDSTLYGEDVPKTSLIGWNKNIEKSTAGLIGLDTKNQKSTIDLTVESPSNKSNQKESVLSTSDSCIICLMNPREYAFLPCGHLSLCHMCVTSTNYFEKSTPCPTCRKPINNVLRIYF